MVLLGLMVMMGGSVVMRGGEVMVFTRRMMLRFMRHWTCLLRFGLREPTFLKQAGWAQHWITGIMPLQFQGFWAEASTSCGSRAWSACKNPKKTTALLVICRKMFHGTGYGRDGLSPWKVRPLRGSP